MSNAAQSFPPFWPSGWPSWPTMWQFSASAPFASPNNPFAAFGSLFAAGGFDPTALPEHVAEFQQRVLELNAGFARALTEEIGFDWASCFTTPDAPDLAVRQLGNEVPLLSIPLQYAAAMMDLCAASQRSWSDAVVRMFGMTPWLAPLGMLRAAQAAQTPGESVVDVPDAAVRETRKAKAAKA